MPRRVILVAIPGLLALSYAAGGVASFGTSGPGLSFAEAPEADLHEHTRTIERPNGSVLTVTALIDHNLADPVAAMDALVPGSVEPDAGGGTGAFVLWRRWAASDLPVGVRYNPANAPAGVDGAVVTRRSIELWNAISGQSFRFAYEGETSTAVGACDTEETILDGVTTLAWSTTMPLGILAQTCALASVSCEKGAGVPRVIEADIRFSTLVNWSVVDVTAAGAYDYYSNSLHELGHVLGLDHTSVAGAVMLPSLRAGQQRRIPAEDDIAGVRALYGGAPGDPGGGGGPVCTVKVIVVGVARE